MKARPLSPPSLFATVPPPAAPDPKAPLAARLRPLSFADIAGQRHLVEDGALFRRAIEAEAFTSLLLQGPPGTGKTTLASIIASSTSSHFIALSALSATVAEVRAVIQEALQRKLHTGQRTLLFLDEIHRFNKAQQDSLLKDIESGDIRFIGATTHNVRFHLTGALLSRSLVFKLEPLSQDDLVLLLQRSLADPRAWPGRQIKAETKALALLAKDCEGDARRALGALELAVLTHPDFADSASPLALNAEQAAAALAVKAAGYDDDAHYDAASAFIKSMRGSDPDAAIYWMARMLAAGEDPRFVARRIVIFASEDVGNADPRALMLATSAAQAVDFIGMPEARIILAQAVTYCATAPKSNASYTAINQALADVEAERILAVPMHLRDPQSSGYNPGGQAYLYPHDAPEGFIPQDYLGVERRYYLPVPRGFEAEITKRLDYWRALRRPDASSHDTP